MAELKMTCLGVRLWVRPDDQHVEVQLLTEDDGVWHTGDRFSSHWIDEQIKTLQAAKWLLENSPMYVKESHGFGYRLSHDVKMFWDDVKTV